MKARVPSVVVFGVELEGAQAAALAGRLESLARSDSEDADGYEEGLASFVIRPSSGTVGGLDTNWSSIDGAKACLAGFALGEVGLDDDSGEACEVIGQDEEIEWAGLFESKVRPMLGLLGIKAGTASLRFAPM